MKTKRRSTPADRDARAVRTLVDSVYAALSGPAGPRDWTRFRAAFAADARLMPSRRAAGGIVREVFDLDAYVASRRALLAQTAFYEREAARRILLFGDVAHVWSAYEARYALDGPVAVRGVNSIQLHRGDAGWRIVSVVWDNERPGLSWPGEESAE